MTVLPTPNSNTKNNLNLKIKRKPTNFQYNGCLKSNGKGNFYLSKKLTSLLIETVIKIKPKFLS